MPDTELAYYILVGAAAAVLAGLVNTVAAPAYVRLRAKAAGEWREATLQSQITRLGINLFAGVGIGALFWLSWGLATVVGVPWWLRGATFTLLLWIFCCVPLLSAHLLVLRMHWSTVVAIAIEWLVTFASIGMACAWSWSGPP